MDAAPQPTDVISGIAHGGYAPIVGAYAQLYQSQNNGYGGAGQFLADNLAQSDGGTTAGGHQLTGLNGEWSFNPSSYSCTTGDLLYVVISGGNSGSASNNNQTLEIAPIGICGVTSGISTSFTYVNELSTVATAYALGNFMTISGSTPPYTVNISAPANNNYYPVSGATVPTFGNCTASAKYIATGSNAVSTGTTCTASGLAHAYSNVANLVNTGVFTLTANTVTPGNTNSSVPAAEINTLANILQGCVNSTGYTTTPGQSSINYTGNGTATITLTAGSANDLLDGTSAITLTNGTTTNLPLTASSNSIADLETAINNSTTFSTAGVTATVTGNSLLITAAGGTLSETGAITDVADDGSTCGSLMALAPSLASTYPTNTLQAAMNLAKNPYVNANNVTKLFNLVTAQSAFGPNLSAAPSDWTVAVNYQVPLPTGATASYAYVPTLDADDNVYVASDSTGVAGNDPFAGAAATIACVDSFAPNGNLNYNAGCDAVATADYMEITPDALGNLWTANTNGSSSVNPTGHVVLRFTASTGSFVGPYTQSSSSSGSRLWALTVDKANNVDFGFDDGNNPNFQYMKFTSGTPNTWVPSTFPATSTFAPNGHVYVLDAYSNIWTPQYGINAGNRGGSLGVMPSTDTTTTAAPAYPATTSIKTASIASGVATNGTGNSGPLGGAVDASGNIWVSNIGNGTWSSALGISESAAPSTYPPTAVNAGTLVFSNQTNTGILQPKYMEVDGADNLWVPDTNGYHEFNLGATAEVSESGGYKPCYLGATGTNTTCGISYDANSRGVGVDAAGNVWVVQSDQVPTTAQQGGVFQIIGSGFPTWPLKAQQQPAIPAGCVTKLSGGTCN